MFSQWSKRGKERAVRTRFSDNGEHPTNIAATCATCGIPRFPSCLVLHFVGGANLIRVETFWTEVSTACYELVQEARAAGVSANAVRRIYSAQNSANVAEHVVTTCSS